MLQEANELESSKHYRFLLELNVTGGISWQSLTTYTLLLWSLFSRLVVAKFKTEYYYNMCKTQDWLHDSVFGWARHLNPPQVGPTPKRFVPFVFSFVIFSSSFSVTATIPHDTLSKPVESVPFFFLTVVFFVWLSWRQSAIGSHNCSCFKYWSYRELSEYNGMCVCDGALEPIRRAT